MKYWSIIGLAGALLLAAITAPAQRQMENLGRGVVAMRTGTSSVYVGWRLLGTDPDDTRFNLYRVTSGVTNLLAANLTTSCNFQDNSAPQASAHTWLVQPVLNGVTQAFSGFTMAAGAPVRQYHAVPLQVPPGGTTIDGVAYTCSANDCSVGDLDGDGEYEIVLKWDPSNSKDNSQSGFTGNVYMDGYKLDGTRLWRIDLGPNIRAGAHYTQFMVYDLDGNGRAEIACKTAPGTRDGLGNYVDGNSNFTVYTNASGYILSGPEYFTIFDGLTGAALATTNYVPGRGTVSAWGDSYGNRVDRFLAGIAYLDGVRPSVVMCRGYYTRTALCAWDWRDGQLTQRWLFDTGHSGGPWSAYKGQGNHQLSVADVDADGRDEIIYGACTINDDGTGLYTTGLGHGDALHVSDLDPARPGFERWGIHESVNTPGSALTDAATGQIIWLTENEDVGRGVAADLTAAYPGAEVWGGTSGLRSIDNQSAGSSPSSSNFAVWWDADLLRELENGTSITKYGGGTLLSASGAASNNGSKSTPALTADFFGDWREEVIWRNNSSTELRIYTTTILATNRLYTLMHDPHYRLAIAWQNVAYNQPPHPGFYLGHGMYAPPVPPVADADLVWRGGGANTWDASTANWRTNGVWSGPNPATAFADGRSVLLDFTGSNHTAVMLAGDLAPARVTVHAAKDYTFAGDGALTGSMSLLQAGLGRLTINNTNHYTGGTFVRGGALFVNGTLTASPVTVERHGTPHGASEFGGAGVLGAGLTVGANTVLTIGPGTNVPGPLTVTNGTALHGALCRFDLSSEPAGVTKTNDAVFIHGNLVLSGTNTIEIRQLEGFLGGGVYPLFTYTDGLIGGLTNLVLEGNFIQTVALTNLPGMIGLVAVVPEAPPPAPTGLVAGAANAFQINLVWSDNATNESAYLIERSLNGVNFTQIDTVPTDTTGYPDSGLAANTIYYYRVRGTNLAGVSDYSNIASASTSTLPTALTWRGDGTGNVWDVATTPNWITSGSPTLYADGTFVTFDQSGSNTPTINLAQVLQPGSVTVSATKNYTFGGSGSLAGPMTLTKSGSGNLTLSTAHSFSGGVTVNAGTVTLQNTAAAGTGPIRFNGGTVTLSVGGEPVHPNALQILADSTLSSGGGNNRVSGAWSGTNTTLNLGISSSGVLTVNGNMSGFHGTVALGNSSGTFRFNSGNANVTFGSPNTTFHLGTSTAWLVNRNGNLTVFLGALAGGSGTTLSGRSSGSGGGGSNYEIGGNHSNTTFNGRIINGSDATAITKVGNGTLTLTGTNTYTGPTAVNGGRLLVNGDHSAATANIVVNSGGTLGGTGVIGGATTIAGTLAPGVALGTLTFQQNLDFSPAGTALFELTKLPRTNDVARVLGNVTYNGTLNVIHLDTAELLEAGDSFQLFDAAGYSGAFANFILPTLDDGLDWNTSRLAVDGRLWVVSTNPPVVQNVSAAGGQITLSGIGGTPGWPYYVVTATDVTLPVAAWTPVATNTFGGTGQFSATVNVTAEPQRFFGLLVPGTF